MTAIVIPVKPLSIAKQRLANVLCLVQRAELVLAMLRDVLTVATSLKEHEVWVVTSDSAVMQLAQQHGVGLIPEPVVGGYNAAINTGLSYLNRHHPAGFNVAIVPADIPLVTQHDLRKLTAACSTDARTIRLAAAHDNEGTNGLFLSRSNLLQPAFGKNSFKRYQLICRSAGITPEILHNTSLAVDIDTAAELQYLIARSVDSVAGEYVRGLPFSADTPAGPEVIHRDNTVAGAKSCH